MPMDEGLGTEDQGLGTGSAGGKKKWKDVKEKGAAEQWEKKERCQGNWQTMRQDFVANQVRQWH